MKRLSILFALFLLFPWLGLGAQEYQPRETWPYLFDNFTNGAILTREGVVVARDVYNITVTDGSLHFIANDQIMKADMSKVHFARFGNETYLNIMGRMYLLVLDSEFGYVLEDVVIDVDAMNEVNIGYGISSSTASSRNLSGLYGASMNMVDLSFMKVVDQKGHGKVLPVKHRIWFDIDGLMIEGTKNSVIGYPGVDPKVARAFFKSNKPDWSDPVFLGKCIEFVRNQLKNQN